MASVIELHRKLLGDAVRNQAFFDALKQVIEPGQTTLSDIGSGTGFLSFLAEKLGARDCYLYEHSEILEVSRELAKKNGCKRCHFVPQHSMAVRKPVRTDVVVSETLGNYALEENIIENLEDAKKRFLKPGGIVIPQHIDQFVCPVISPRLTDEINIWDRVGFGLTFDLAKIVCMNNMYVKRVELHDLLPDGDQKWDCVDFRKKNASVRSGTITWTAEKPMTIYGFALWWGAELVKGIRLTTSPHAASTHWDQIFLPVVEPIPLKAGQRLQLGLKSDTRPSVKVNLMWNSAVLGHGGKKHSLQKMDMRRGHIN